MSPKNRSLSTPFRKKTKLQATIRAPRKRVCEFLESRHLLSASAFLQGTVTDINHAPLAGAIVTLYPHGGSTALGSFTTGADGRYLFTSNSVPSLIPGAEYDLVETPPAGYANSTTPSPYLTQLSTLVGQTANSFDVNIPSPAAASVNIQPTVGPGGFFNNYDVLTWTYNGKPNPSGSAGDTVEQFPATVNGHTFLTFCSDPGGVFQYGTDAFSVLPTTVFPTAAPSYSDRISYLYDKYGTQTLNAQQGVGLQLAIWTLLSDAGGDLDSGNFVPADFASSTSSLATKKFIDVARAPGYGGAGYTTFSFLQEEQQAADFLNESFGKSDAAWFLQVDGSSPITLGSQSLVATDQFNFTNKFAPTISTAVSTAQAPTPDVDVLKTPDQSTIQAGQQAGFTISVYNEGTGTATGVTVNDPLPAGIGNDINWTIDSTAAGTNPSYFTITGSTGSQVLTLSSTFSGAPTNDSLTPGQAISVHIVGLTTTNDVDPPAGAKPAPGPAILPGTELTSTGVVAVDNGHQNLTPESQAKSRPEITVTNLPFQVQPGYMILLENSIDTSIPEAGPPAGKGAAGVPSTIEFNRVADWSDIAVFANITDSSGTHGVVYWCSAPENTGNQDTGTPLDTLIANLGSSNPGLAAPKAADNIVFLVEREAGRSGDSNPSQLSGGNGGGQSNPNNAYLTNNITYNTHSDPPGPTPTMIFTGALPNTVTVNAANEPAAEMNAHATATITITTAAASAPPDVDVNQRPPIR